jgi:peroxygenase
MRHARSRIGLGRAISFGAIFVIHGTFSYVTSPSFLPSLFFPIYLDRMHRTKHGSDSGVYDTARRSATCSAACGQH